MDKGQIPKGLFEILLISLSIVILGQVLMHYSFVPFSPVSAGLFVYCERFFIGLYWFCFGCFAFLPHNNKTCILEQYTVF